MVFKFFTFDNDSDYDNEQDNNVKEEDINCPVCGKVWDEENPDGCEYYKNLCDEGEDE